MSAEDRRAFIEERIKAGDDKKTIINALLEKFPALKEKGQSGVRTANWDYWIVKRTLEGRPPTTKKEK